MWLAFGPVRRWTRYVLRMRGLRDSVVAGLCVLALLPVFTANAFAAGKTEKRSCGGSNILAELAVQSPEIHARVTAEAEKIANTQALLWRISRDGIEDSFLFGTAHLTDPRITQMPEPATKALDNARLVALEVADVSPAAVATALGTAPHLMMFTDGGRLDLLLSPEDFAKVREQLEIARLPSAFAGRLKPWVVSTLMAISECERNRIESGMKVLDLLIAERATKKGIPVVGLETIEDQLSASARVSIEEQVALLRASLAMADRADDQRETLIQLYLGRQLGLALPLQKAMAQRHGGGRDANFAGFQTHLVDRRNRQMRTHLLPLLAEGNVFVAVGALHLIGETGLVTLLRKAGYDVTPIE